MDNPFQIPILAIGLLAGTAAGLIPGRSFVRWLNRIYILLFAAFAAWGLEILFVDWAYTHPFNPNDGGPRVVAMTFGWAVALINPILPAFLGVTLLRVCYGRIFTGRGAT